MKKRKELASLQKTILYDLVGLYQGSPEVVK